jgi:hypothetical protein
MGYLVLMISKKKGIGPKEAERNERQFTEEQLKEGNKIISLQYGTNKGKYLNLIKILARVYLTNLHTTFER